MAGIGFLSLSTGRRGGLQGGRDVTQLTAHVDVFPTLLDLCGIETKQPLHFDGRSTVPLLKGATNEWPDRVLVTDSQRVRDPIKWRKSAVMTSRWRLINGQELYDMHQDPGRRMTLRTRHPDQVERLTAFYDSWWDELVPSFQQDAVIYLGHPAENPARLTSHDWLTHGATPWNQAQIRLRREQSIRAWPWIVKFVESGEYTFRIRRWPAEDQCRHHCTASCRRDVPGVKAMRTAGAWRIPAVKAVVKVGDVSKSVAVEPGDVEAVVHMQVPAGKTTSRRPSRRPQEKSSARSMHTWRNNSPSNRSRAKSGPGVREE